MTMNLLDVKKPGAWKDKMIRQGCLPLRNLVEDLRTKPDGKLCVWEGKEQLSFDPDNKGKDYIKFDFDRHIAYKQTFVNEADVYKYNAEKTFADRKLTEREVHVAANILLEEEGLTEEEKKRLRAELPNFMENAKTNYMPVEVNKWDDGATFLVTMNDGKIFRARISRSDVKDAATLSVWQTVIGDLYTEDDLEKYGKLTTSGKIKPNEQRIFREPTLEEYKEFKDIIKKEVKGEELELFKAYEPRLDADVIRDLNRDCGSMIKMVNSITNDWSYYECEPYIFVDRESKEVVSIGYDSTKQETYTFDFKDMYAVKHEVVRKEYWNDGINSGYQPIWETTKLNERQISVMANFLLERKELSDVQKQSILEKLPYLNKDIDDEKLPERHETIFRKKTWDYERQLEQIERVPCVDEVKTEEAIETETVTEPETLTETETFAEPEKENWLSKAKNKLKEALKNF